MPGKKPVKLKPAELRAAFHKDIAACWEHAKKLHPDHRPYAFALYGVEDVPHLTPHVLTEESLKQVAGRYLQKGYYDTIEEACKGLRYSVADSPLFNDLEEQFSTVNALVAPHEASWSEDKGYALLAKAAMEAFEELDQRKLFGTGAERNKLLLIIITEDVEKDWSTPSAKRLNPAAVFKRFEAETRIEGNYACCNALAVSPDGRSLYSAGSRGEGNAKKGESPSEINAYDIAGGRVKLRWSFLFPSFGDSGRALACTRDGSTVLVLRAKYSDKVCRTLIMRFGRDDNKPLEQAEVVGEPSSFALSPNDSRMAVSMYDKTLHILDENFKVLKSLTVPSKPYRVKFLNSGDLLVATERGLLRITAEFKIVPTRFKDGVFGLATDDAEKLLIVSRSNRANRTESGVHILKLPSLQTVRTITVPGFQAGKPAISPDGRHLAIEACAVATPRRFVVVFETATGKEVARRKSKLFADPAFLLDNRTLALPESGFTTSEPIVLWSVPGL